MRTRSGVKVDGRPIASLIASSIAMESTAAP
jgi:hypothetical protein